MLKAFQLWNSLTKHLVFLLYFSFFFFLLMNFPLGAHTRYDILKTWRISIFSFSIFASCGAAKSQLFS